MENKYKIQKVLFAPITMGEVIPAKKGHAIVVHGYMEVNLVAGVIFEYKKVGIHR